MIGTDTMPNEIEPELAEAIRDTGDDVEDMQHPKGEAALQAAYNAQVIKTTLTQRQQAIYQEQMNM